MKVQLPVRWSDHRKPSNNSEAYLRKIIDGEEPTEDEEIEYVYGSLIIDTKDIRSYNDIDEEHCILRTYFNDSYCVALNFEDLKQVMSELTGDNITIIRKMEAKKSAPRKPKKGGSKEDDLLL